MSTLKHNITAQRLALLATRGEILFHVNDLANLWRISGNTLRTALKRYVQNKLLYRIYRGFYAMVPLSQLDPVLVGAKALHRYCYLSTESILYEHGFISQKPGASTFMSERSLKFKISGYTYISRQLKPEYLYQSEGVYRENGILKATPERAIADLLYFNPKKHFDKPVNWQKIKALQKVIGYPLTPHRYDFTKS